MKELLKKLMMKEEDKDVDLAQSKMAKMDILKELIEMMDEKIGNDYENGLQKVTVAAKDQEGLKKGLEKAQEILPEIEDLQKSEMNEEDNEEYEDEEVENEEDENEEDKKKKKRY